MILDAIRQWREKAIAEDIAYKKSQEEDLQRRREQARKNREGLCHAAILNFSSYDMCTAEATTARKMYGAGYPSYALKEVPACKRHANAENPKWGE